MDLSVEERPTLDGVAVLVDEAVLSVGLPAIAGDCQGKDSKHSCMEKKEKKMRGLRVCL